MVMQIRRAEKKDMKKLLSFLNEIYIYEQKINHKIISPSEEFLDKIQEEIWEQLQDDNHLFLVWEIHDEVIWFLMWKIGDKPNVWSYSLFSYIEWIYIDENFRKKWYAQKLCEEFFKWAKSKGSDRVLLDVLHENMSAKKFYEKLWFSVHTITLGKNLN